MGASSSTANPSSPEVQEEESLAASTGSLPILRTAFANLSPPSTHAVPPASLQEVFSLDFKGIKSESLAMPDCFMQLLSNVGPSIVDLFFKSDEKGISWVDFLRGYNKCCGRMPASASLNILYRLYSATSKKANISTNLELNSECDDENISESLLLSEVLMLLWMCWLLERASRVWNPSKEEITVCLPDLHHLITSVFMSCNEVGNDLSIEDPNIFGLASNVPVQKLQMWILSTIPGLVHCVPLFVKAKLKAFIASENDIKPSISSYGESSSRDVCDNHLLTCGRAWAISLILRNVADELQDACFSNDLDNLLYRSSIHGKGISRFWSNVEGYHGPVLILLSVNAKGTSGDEIGDKQWVVGVQTAQGFENRDTFYGSSGYLFAISPIFRVFPASGKDKNFVYSHLHPTGRVYDAHPKPVGIAFGGTSGNERMFIDEDFAKVVIRHHAFDKTYQPGPLIFNQGFLPTEASILDVEVWGLGGQKAKQLQDAYKKRETLFSEQRRKVDLKTFGNWEDSPEKMMMDMVSDPNTVRREDR